MLDLSKIEAGQLALSVSDYSMPELVERVVLATGPLAGEKGLALKVSLQDGLPFGQGDDRRITQVLLNLVGNAIKFTETGEVAVNVTAADGVFEVAVADTGPGIAPDDQERVFEEFRQLDGSSTRTKGGTGLGLAISRKIVELHAGRLWVESELGRGLDVPVHAPGPPAREECPRMTKHILVVEDQEDNRRILRDLLTSAGYELIEAVTGTEGVRLARSHRPDLILMDIQLPELDGHEATRQIKADPDLRPIPIVVVTSYALSGDEAKALAAGADAYVTKPFSPRQLLAKVRDLLG